MPQFEQTDEVARQDDKAVVERRDILAPVEIRVAGDGKKRMLVGYAAVFNSVTDIGWFREQIAPGAFADAVKEDDVRGLFNHDSNLILGRNKAGTLSLKEDRKGLYFEIDVPDTQVGRDVLTSVERGDVSGCSFAFMTLADEWDYSNEDSPLRTLKKVRLFDVGPVVYPAYADTSVAARSLEAARSREVENDPPEASETEGKPEQNSEKPSEKDEKEAETREEQGETANGSETPSKPTPMELHRMDAMARKAERIIKRNRRSPEA